MWRVYKTICNELQKRLFVVPNYMSITEITRNIDECIS